LSSESTSSPQETTAHSGHRTKKPDISNL
jgi:hypothetical protein